MHVSSIGYGFITHGNDPGDISCRVFIKSLQIPMAVIITSPVPRRISARLRIRAILTNRCSDYWKSPTALNMESLSLLNGAVKAYSPCPYAVIGILPADSLH